MDEVREWRGVRDLVAAEVLIDDANEFKCGEPFKIAGVAKITRTTATASAVHYYDNEAAVALESKGADTVNIEVSAIPFDVTARINGQTYNEKKGMYVEGNGTSPYFAIGYITKRTDGTEVYVWREKGKFGVPDSEHSTENEGADAVGQTLTYTGIATKHRFVENDNKPAKAVSVETDKNTAVTEEEFFATVQTPDTVPDSATVV